MDDPVSAELQYMAMAILRQKKCVNLNLFYWDSLQFPNAKSPVFAAN